ncbi:MAG TPA: hypothetical protein VMH34_00605 [Gammaproteobacteria bacterium]|nr:hypothetical protein [Gammaproteobacteria bacterium]
MRRVISTSFLLLMVLPAVSEGKATIANSTGTLYLSCPYDKPAELSGTYVQIIIDQAKNTVVTGSECQVSDVHINPARIAFKCGDELDMTIDRLNGHFLATVKPQGRASGYCVKEKGPRF